MTADLSTRATGLLAQFQAAGALAIPDVQVATALLRLSPAPDPADDLVGLAAALTVRALRHGSVAVDLSSAHADVTADEEYTGGNLPWPDPDEWIAACRAHRLVADGPAGPSDRPLRWDAGLLSLQKYWQQEDAVAATIARRALQPPVQVDRQLTASLLDELFPYHLAEAQRVASAVAAVSRFAVVTGGPGTGKTTAIARLLVLLRALHGPALRVALAAPTGKAAARISEATAGDLADLFDGGFDRVERFTPPTATTLHRLLGWRPDAAHRFRHDRHNPLPHDVVVVDEVSMVSLTMMARLMEALRPHARLILVGDPDQLSSIEAGAILADVVSVSEPATPDRAAAVAEVSGGTAPTDLPVTGTVSLWHNFRSEEHITALAGAIRDGEPDAVIDLLRATDAGAPGKGQVVFLETPAGSLPERAAGIDGIRREVVDRLAAISEAAQTGDAGAALRQLDRHRVLCAHREGPYGVAHWNALIESWRVAAHGLPPEVSGWRIGQCLIATKNDPSLGLFNGDSGVIVATQAGPMAAFGRDGGTLLVPPVRLDTVLSLDAMTIHRGQGSQFGAVTVILPPPESPLLTRELLYTAVTRAQTRVQLVGSADAVVAAVRRRVTRASGLAKSLQRHLATA